MLIITDVSLTNEDEKLESFVGQQIELGQPDESLLSKHLDCETDQDETTHAWEIVSREVSKLTGAKVSIFDTAEGCFSLAVEGDIGFIVVEFEPSINEQ